MDDSGSTPATARRGSVRPGSRSGRTWRWTMSSADGTRRLRRWGALALPVALAAGLVSAGPASAAEVYPRPYDGKWSVTGHGNGHGHGMSQYGALGAAKAGRTWQEIIDFYYPGTSRGPIANDPMKVRVASLGGAIEAYPASGL